ncbi:hypothetical protein CKO28_00095 [Rhodovibrio sodomensis]|uniref:Uncharacterized protein n=1 Tax=Rhodovibrio sodomensis TaxID=1088 RepID=A0ABS1D8U3_9PROT|nr:hypothetical protein [Rhodovibrio sodomensis]MBK1666439.1 hypothetical protein [Rhodovibrio sodomensis]
MFKNLKTRLTALVADEPISTKPVISHKRRPQVGDTVMAYAPDSDSPNKPGIMARPCMVIWSKTDASGQLHLQVAPGTFRNVDKAGPRDIVLSSKDSLDATGMDRPVRFQMDRTVSFPWDEAHIATTAGKPPVAGRMLNRDFEQARTVYGRALRAQETKRSLRAVNSGPGIQQPDQVASISPMKPPQRPETPQQSNIRQVARERRAAGDAR